MAEADSDFEWEKLRRSLDAKDTSEDVLFPIAVAEPPCRHCRFWSPRVLTDARGNYAGTRFCIAEKMSFDFLCFRKKD